MYSVMYSVQGFVHKADTDMLTTARQMAVAVATHYGLVAQVWKGTELVLSVNQQGEVI